MYFMSRLLLLIMLLIPAQNLQAQTDEAGREKELDTFIEKGMNQGEINNAVETTSQMRLSVWNLFSVIMPIMMNVRW